MIKIYKKNIVVNSKLLSISKNTALIMFFAFFLTSSKVQSQVIEESIAEREGVSIVENLGGQIPLDVKLTNSKGEEVVIGDYFKQGKPVLLSFVYFDCPMLCTLVLNGVSNGLKGVDWTPGKEFQILSISIDERETTELAAQKKSRYMNSLEKKEGESSWEFFTSDNGEVKRLADAIGFNYKYDEKSNQFMHPASIFMLTDDGKISRYLYNASYKSQDIKFALMDAAQGKFMSTMEKLVLYCFRYDPSANSYVLFARNTMKLGGVITMILLGSFLGFYWLKEKYKKLT